MQALLAFLQRHAHLAELDDAAMARLNDALVPAALTAWPALQDVLETEARPVQRGVTSPRRAVFAWANGARAFREPLARDQTRALIQLLMLQVGPPVLLLCAASTSCFTLTWEILIQWSVQFFLLFFN